MNDSREWLYALDLVKQVLQARAKLRSDKYWLEFIADLSGSLWRIEGLYVCVFSLTAMPNQLSQWRAYCPPEGGYNLTFDVDTLVKHLDRHRFQLKQCIYEEGEQKRLIEGVVDGVLGAVGPIDSDAAIMASAETALEDFGRELLPVAPILKHPDFSEEQEWRASALVGSIDPRMEYRIKGAMAIPHCVLDLETADTPFPITQVTVGPNANQELARRGLQSIIYRAGLHINVGTSSTPLRNL